MRWYLPLAFLLLLVLIGCGGGGGGNTATVSGSTFQIAWPARSRDPLTHNLSSAQSVMVVLAQADASGADVVVRIDRDPTQSGAYTGTYTVTQSVKRSATSLTATFYALPGEAGDVVGSAIATVDFASDSANFAAVAVTGAVKTVTVLDAAPLFTNSSATQLLASAKDAQGMPLAVSPGSVAWTLSSGTSLTLTNDGVVTPIAVGVSTVIATIDGVASPAKSLTIALPNITEPSFGINWPARTRDGLSHNLTSALSAEVTFVQAAADGSDIVLKVNRNATNLAAHTETYPVGKPVQPSVNTVTFRFFAEPDATGSVVGTASANVQPNGSDLGMTNVALVGKIAKVSVVDPGVMHLGDAGVQLFVSALDAANNPIAVSAGSANWTVVSGGNNLLVSSDGVANVTAVGTATVRAVVDGIVSPNALITIQGTDPGPTVQAVDLSVSEVTYNAASGKIWAAILADDFNYANSVVSINPATGAIGDRIPVGATPGLIAVSDDGKYAYVTLGRTQIRRLNLTTHTVDTTFTVDEGREYFDLKAVPGSPKSFAVATDPIAGVNFSVWDDGIRRTGTGAVGYKIHFASPSLIYGDGHDTLFTNNLSSGQIDWSQTALNVSGMSYSDGRFYTKAGKVIDAATKSEVLSLPTTNVLIDKELAVSSSDNRVYFVTWAPNKDKRILTFDKTSGVEKPLVSTGIFNGGAQNLVACGNRTVVFRLFGSGVKRSLFIVRNLP